MDYFIVNAVTEGNEHDVTVTDKVLNGEKHRVYGDSSYVGIDKKEKHQSREVEWQILQRIGNTQKLDKR